MTEPIIWLCLGLIVVLSLAVVGILLRARSLPKCKTVRHDLPVKLPDAGTDRLIAELNAAVRELRERCDRPAPIALARTRHLREEVVRLADSGMDAREIAGRLPIPLAEADLIVRVRRLLRAQESAKRFEAVGTS